MKLMVLGCGMAQLDLIKESKRLGYTTIACDKRPEMEAAKVVDKYYQVDYMDRDKVYEIAEKEKIDGIISNSEPAMVHVAYISQKMNLIGNTVESIETLSSKAKFRELQRKAGVFVPEHYAVDSYEELLDRARSITYPAVIKPTVSTATQGTTRLDEYDDKKILEAYNTCKSFSRNGQVSIEQYVPMNGLFVTEIDVVVVNENIIWDGMMCTFRSKETPMLPETYVLPIDLSDEKKTKVKEAVEKILKTAGIKHGQYNVEAYFTNDDEVFVIEINPRQGGNYIPKLIQESSGVNLSKLLVSTAVGDMTYYQELKESVRKHNYVTMHVVYARKEGILDDLYISSEIKPFVKWTERRIQNGEEVRRGSTVFDGIACFDLHFGSYEKQQLYTRKIEKYIYPFIK